MDERQSVVIRLPDLELGEAGRAARQLREAILDEAPGVEVGVEKDDPTTMDFGATLIVVLGTPAVVALAHGIAKWMMRERTKVVIEIDGDKTVITAAGTINENVARLVEAIGKS